MNKKILICKILEEWYFIDSILLNGHAKKVITEEKDYKEYLSIKHALLSNLYEMYNHIGYIPQITKIAQSDKVLQESAVLAAKKSKHVASRMIQDQKFVVHMKQVVMNEAKKGNVTNIRDFAEDVINTRFSKMALDNVLIGMPIIEATLPQKASDFNGQIFENAYLMMRSSLIDICKKYSPIFQKKTLNEIGMMGLAAAGLITLGGFKLAGALGRSVENFSNQCHNRCGTMRLTTTAKQICVLKCEIEVHNKIIASLRSSAAATNNEEARDRYARDVRRAQLKISKLQRELAQLQARNIGVNQNVQASTTGARVF